MRISGLLILFFPASTRGMTKLATFIRFRSALPVISSLHLNIIIG